MVGGAVNAAVPRYGLTPAQLLAWVSDSCRAQGLPVVVTDPTVVARVGVLLGATRRKPSGGRGAPTAARLAQLGTDRDGLSPASLD
jgi:hypothetical protein